MDAGTTQPPRCAHCGATHDAALRFCPTTGHPIVQAAPAAPAAPVAPVAPVAPAPSAVPAVGAEVDAKYRLTRLLGQGALGPVLEAEHLLAGRKVALRFLHERLRGGDFERRFLDEVRAVGAVGNENIVDMLDVGMSAQFGPYSVMELVDGES